MVISRTTAILQNYRPLQLTENMTLKCAVTMSNEYQELLISDSPKINLVRNAEKNQGKSQNLSFIKFYFWVISQH